jgi:hypothetical protein
MANIVLTIFSGVIIANALLMAIGIGWYGKSLDYYFTLACKHSLKDVVLGTHMQGGNTSTQKPEGAPVQVV